MSEETFELPSQYNMIILFGKCKEGNVKLVYMNELRAIYKLRYSKMTYLDYLNEVLNQKLDISDEKETECFDLNKEITEKYNSHSLSDFINIYYDKPQEDTFRLKNGLSKEEQETIFYYLFKNNYLTVFDDYIGFYYVIKSNSLYQP
ncbi:hypothetical protein [Flavobacterium sp. '19STA2R22 D10 B1']|uniref:hypothetical protein n=1 Tax=Flavobacterium aerium TaxID=3037261 RepID=UPI00278C1373|nr:hypothetical protein [Flavobacterium sp. '19STA2R22 D10 B1']